MQISCAACDRPMEVAEGQLAFVHRRCRALARKKGLKQAIRNSKQRYDTERALVAVEDVVMR